MKNIFITIIGIIFYTYFSYAQTTVPAIQWQKCLGGTLADKAYSIEQTNDGGYIIAGGSTSNNMNVTGNHDTLGFYQDCWVVKIDTGGNIQWQKAYGGINDDVATSICQTNDGGYIFAGYSSSNDGDVSGHHGDVSYQYYDYWIVKIDTIGIIQWQKSLGGNLDDYAYSIVQANDGNYVVAGISQSNDGEVSGHHGSSYYNDCWIVKIDTIGNILWQKSLGGTNMDNAYSVDNTNDGGFIIAGSTESSDGDVTGTHLLEDYWIAKLDNYGNLQWQKSYGGSNIEYAKSIKHTNDNGYIVAGSSNSSDGNITNHHGINVLPDCWIVKLDSIGNLLWQKSLGGIYEDKANSIIQTSDGGYILASNSFSNNDDVTGHHGSTSYSDYWVAKLNTSGIIQWQKSLGGSNIDEAQSIHETNDGGLIVAGFSQSSNQDITGHLGTINFTDYWIVKLASLTEIENNSNISITEFIYPNPANDIVTIKLYSIGKGNINLNIYDFTGKLILNINKDLYEVENEINIETSSFDNGIYFYQLTINKDIKTGNFIIIK